MVRKMRMAISDGGEPEDDNAIQEHGQRGRALDTSSRPTRWFFESQVALGTLKSDLDGPAEAVPAQDLFGRRFSHGRKEGLPSPFPLGASRWPRRELGG